MKTITSLALFALTLSQGACATASSSYHRTTASSGELVWAFEGELQVTQNGRVVSGGNWAGLEDAVSCVPRARRLASDARSSNISGKTLAIAGAVTTIASVVGGSYLLLTDDLSNGLLVMGAGSAAGLTAAAIGGHKWRHADPKAIDAVNIYNDEHQSTVGCANR